MRIKPDKSSKEFDITQGLDFGTDITEQPEKPKKPIPQSKRGTPAEIDPNRNYSKYYDPKPKNGSKGGKLGRGAVDASERKVQFSMTCTPAQKERFMEASKKAQRKLPDFICIAVEEYIKNNNL